MVRERQWYKQSVLIIALNIYTNKWRVNRLSVGRGREMPDVCVVHETEMNASHFEP